MKRATISLVLCLYAHVALGGVIASTPSPGWAEHAWSETEEFIWGATARNMISVNGDWELGIGRSPEMTQGGRSEGHLDWGGAGTLHTFSLGYNPATAKTTWTIDQQVTMLMDQVPLFSDMYIQLKTGHANALIAVSNATLTVGGAMIDVEDLCAFGDRASDQTGLQYVHINFDEAQSDLEFLLEGTLFIDWSGTAPSRDQMGMHLKMTRFGLGSIPEPASIVMVILASLTGLLIRRRFR